MDPKKIKNSPVAPDAETSLANEGVATTPLDATAPLVPPPTPPTTTAVAGPEKLTPTEWARRKGLLVEGPLVPEPHAKGFHAAAEQLHGWAWHAQNYQAPEQAFKLTEADYDAALVAAGEFPRKPAHKAALATNYPEPVVPEHIAKACAAADAKPAAEKKG